MKSINRDNLEKALVKKNLKKQQKGMIVDTKRPHPDLTLKTSLADRKKKIHTLGKQPSDKTGQQQEREVKKLRKREKKENRKGKGLKKGELDNRILKQGR